MEEIAGILDPPEVTAFLPESLHFQSGTTDPLQWATTFSAENNTYVSSVRLHKDDNTLVGLLMLREEQQEENSNSIHIGYTLGKPFWGHGLATELNHGLVNHMKERNFRGVLCGGVAKGNPASVAVLKKVGFVPQPDGSGSEDVDFFMLSFV